MQGLELLASSVVVLDASDNILFLNSAAEQLFDVSARLILGSPVARLFHSPEPVEALVAQGRRGEFGHKRMDMELLLPGRREPLDLLVTVVVAEDPAANLLIELQENDTRLRAAREERMLELAYENRDMLRNLAHEVKNPLGGIRGAAQMLESELADAGLRQCAQVIVKEADRLQVLVDRLLAPHRRALVSSPVNIHEVCEHVRNLLQAEFAQSLEIARDYDTSLPEIHGDREQLIQVLLNLVRNSAQALGGSGRIDIVTRVARQVTIARKRHKLALELHVIDNGPGIGDDIRDRVFLPLVSGRDDGTGLGLTLVQSFVQQHGGSIDCESAPGCTDFRLLFPLPSGRL